MTQTCRHVRGGAGIPACPEYATQKGGITIERTTHAHRAIHGVPIFALGEHRGFRYDDAWARRAVEAFRRLKRQHGYLPPVIIGHTSDAETEKPAVGFMDGLRIAGNHLVADLTGLSREVYEQIRAGRWPYRSIEVMSRAAQITALALLGGTPPYMKSPPLRFSESGAATHHTKGAQMEDTSPMEAKQFSEEEVARLVEDARAEERSRAEETLAATRHTVEQLQAAAHEAAVARFRENLRGFGYAPALVDMPELKALFDQMAEQSQPVRFGQNETTTTDLLERVLENIARHAAKEAAFPRCGQQVPSAPHQRFWEADAPAETTVPAHVLDRASAASVERLNRAQKMAKEDGITFRDALIRVMES